jgi:acetolactate synthase-1/3 small subunit
MGNTQNEALHKHVISLLVSNKPGVLIRIALVFTRRGYNIDSLVVSESNDPDFSVMNITATGDAKVLDHILRQLNKLIDVVSARDRTGEDILQRELGIYKIRCEGTRRLEVLQLAHAMDCEPIDVSAESVILQAHGESEKLDNITRVLGSYGLIEVVRTGKVLMSRGSAVTSL